MAIVFDDEQEAQAPAQTGSGKVVFDDEQPPLTDAFKNIVPDAENIGKNALNTGLKIDKGLWDLPSDAVQSGQDILSGNSPSDTPLGQDASSIGSGVSNAVKAIPKQIEDLGSRDAWIQHPVGNTLNAASLVSPLMMRGKGAAVGAEDLAAHIPPHDTPMDSPAPETAAPGDVVPLRQDAEPPLQAPSLMKPSPTDQAPPQQAASSPDDPLKNVRDVSSKYVSSKYVKAQQNPSLISKIGNYLKEESNNFGAKDIGLQPGAIKTMGKGFEGIDRANSLIDYARDKGYFNPGLSDAGRKQMIQKSLTSSGQNLDAIRTVADQRSRAPVDAIKAQVQQELSKKYGSGVNKAPNEIANVLEEIDKAPKTFHGMSELATHLNRSATDVGKLGQHPGPTTDAANIVARINNDALRKVLNPNESRLYTQSLRDYGANKKLEQTVSAASRRAMGARSNQRGFFDRMFQEALDRGGYRAGSNIASRVGSAITKGNVKTLPQFFEELAHQSNHELDDVLDSNAMSKGGMVTPDMANFVRGKVGQRR